MRRDSSPEPCCRSTPVGSLRRSTDMRYKTFGRRTGLRVSEYCLGTGNFGTAWGASADDDEARRIFNRFAEAGGTFIDSADSYQKNAESETLLGDFLLGDRD